MKLTPQQLRRIIKEELLREFGSDEEAEAFRNSMYDVNEWPDQFEKLSDAFIKISSQLRQLVKTVEPNLEELEKNEEFMNVIKELGRLDDVVNFNPHEIAQGLANLSKWIRTIMAEVQKRSKS